MDYIIFPSLSLVLCLYYPAWPYYYYAGAFSKTFAYFAKAFVVHQDNTWQCVQISHNFNTSDLAIDNFFIDYSPVLMVETSRRVGRVVEARNHTRYFIPALSQLS